MSSADRYGPPAGELRDDPLEWGQAVKGDLCADDQEGDPEAVLHGKLDESRNGSGHVGASGNWSWGMERTEVWIYSDSLTPKLGRTRQT
jgi:hypothetical protein